MLEELKSPLCQTVISDGSEEISPQLQPHYRPTLGWCQRDVCVAGGGGVLAPPQWVCGSVLYCGLRTNTVKFCPLFGQQGRPSFIFIILILLKTGIWRFFSSYSFWNVGVGSRALSIHLDFFSVTENHRNAVKGSEQCWETLFIYLFIFSFASDFSPHQDQTDQTQVFYTECLSAENPSDLLSLRLLTDCSNWTAVKTRPVLTAAPAENPDLQETMTEHTHTHTLSSEGHSVFPKITHINKHWSREAGLMHLRVWFLPPLASRDRLWSSVTQKTNV